MIDTSCSGEGALSGLLFGSDVGITRARTSRLGQRNHGTNGGTYQALSVQSTGITAIFSTLWFVQSANSNHCREKCVRNARFLMPKRTGAPGDGGSYWWESAIVG